MLGRERDNSGPTLDARGPVGEASTHTASDDAEGWGLQGKVGECLLLRAWVVRAGFLEEETLNEHPLKGE